MQKIPESAHFFAVTIKNRFKVPRLNVHTREPSTDLFYCLHLPELFNAASWLNINSVHWNIWEWAGTKTISFRVQTKIWGQCKLTVDRYLSHSCLRVVHSQATLPPTPGYLMCHCRPTSSSLILFIVCCTASLNILHSWYLTDPVGCLLKLTLRDWDIWVTSEKKRAPF